MRGVARGAREGERVNDVLPQTCRLALWADREWRFVATLIKSNVEAANRRQGMAGHGMKGCHVVTHTLFMVGCTHLTAQWPLQDAAETAPGPDNGHLKLRPARS